MNHPPLEMSTDDGRTWEPVVDVHPRSVLIAHFNAGHMDNGHVWDDGYGHLYRTRPHKDAAP